jgi:hypothetical protein
MNLKFGPGRPFLPSLMFANPSEEPFRNSLQVYALGLTHRYWTELERLARHKHKLIQIIYKSRLLQIWQLKQAPSLNALFVPDADTLVEVNFVQINMP